MKTGLALSFAFSAAVSSAQFTYHHAFALSSGAYYPYVAVDGSGNIYVASSFEGSFDVDPGPGVHTLTQTGGTGPDLFVAKYADTGTLIWAFKLGDLGQQSAVGIAVNSSQVCILGTTNSPLSFDLDPGPGVTNASSGYVDPFVARYDLDGNFLSSFSVGGIEVDFSHDLVLYPNGDVAICGSYHSNDFDADPGSGSTVLPPANSLNAFVLKYNASNELLFAQGIGGNISTESAVARALHRPVSSGLLVTGQFGGAVVDFDPGPDTFTFNSAGAHDIFVQRLDANGDLLWAKRIGDIDTDIGYGVTTDSNENVYLCGSSNSATIDLDPGPGVQAFSGSSGDIVVVKLDSDGDYVWGMRIGGEANDRGNTIAIDSEDHLFIAGVFGDINVDFDPGAGQVLLSSSSASENDIFITQFDTDGTFVDAFDIGGTGIDDIESMALTTTGRLWVVGRKRGIVDADPGSGLALLDSLSSMDFFAAAYDHAHPVGEVEHEKPLPTLQPNPAFDHVVLNLPWQGPALIELSDSNGRLLRTHAIGAFPAEVDLRDVPSGILTVTITTAGRTVTRKLLKLR
ncbi:MAG: SBBP repeat-containing protein [Flavobacteriales bacterium]|nr:SBBP repeat-containing protein [Flavobacteriales bacterium]